MKLSPVKMLFNKIIFLCKEKFKLDSMKTFDWKMNKIPFLKQLNYYIEYYLFFSFQINMNFHLKSDLYNTSALFFFLIFIQLF